MLSTASRQVPQPVAARVRAEIWPVSRAPSCQAAQMTDLVTPLHWQMTARPGSVVGVCATVTGLLRRTMSRDSPGPPAGSRRGRTAA